jgi:hypothetical protein
LLLNLKTSKFKLDILQVTHENNQKLQGGIHGELPEHYWGAIKGKLQFDFMNIELFKIDFLLDMSLVCRLIVLFEVVKCLFDLINVIHLLVIELQLL